MKGKKKKEEDTSSETPKKKSGASNRLSGMIESMQKRGSPIRAHKVATQYFESFKKERNIPTERNTGDISVSENTAVAADKSGEAITAVPSAVPKTSPRKVSLGKKTKEAEQLKDLDSTLSPSELSVYRAMYEVCEGKNTDSFRFGLKLLRELTGLSDKTVRVAIHSLQRKLCIKVIEPSEGIYGRKFLVLRPEQINLERIKAGIEIDPTTKKVIGDTTPVNNAVITKVATGVNTEVDTAVGPVRSDDRSHREKTEVLYERYTGRRWSENDEPFYEKISGRDIEVIEAAIILKALKGEGDAGNLSDIEQELNDLGDSIKDGYLEQLREVWKSVKSGKE